MSKGKEARLKELVSKEAELLDKMITYKRNNRLEFFDRPNPLQEKLLKAWDDQLYKVFVFSGGNRTGKTTIGAILVLCTVMEIYPWDKSKLFVKPHSKPMKVRYVGQDWEKQIKAVVIPELKKWMPASEKFHMKKNNIGVEAYWTCERTGGVIEVLSNLQASDTHEGWQGDLVVYDEPPKRDIRVANARGLVDRCGRELFCMTLLKEAWVDREVIKAVNKDGTPDKTVFSIHGTSYDNVGYGITKDGLEQFKKTLTPDEIEARINGKPSYLTGLVYGSFNRDTCMIDEFEVPLDWVVDIAIDIHPRTPQAVLFVATAPNGYRYVVDEIWGNGDGKWVGEQIIRTAKKRCYRVNRIVIDPLSKADGNNDSTVFEKVYKVLFTYGYSLEVASKDKVSGILLVKEHFKGANNMPSLFVFNRCVTFLKEIEGYMYDKDTNKPVDKDDHMMENLYRLLLLNTVYSDPNIDEEEDSDNIDGGRSEVGGY